VTTAVEWTRRRSSASSNLSLRPRVREKEVDWASPSPTVSSGEVADGSGSRAGSAKAAHSESTFPRSAPPCPPTVNRRHLESFSHLLPPVFVSPTPDGNRAGNNYSASRKEDSTAIRDRGSTRAFRKRTDQCRCGPVTRPVAPTLPITAPVETRASWLTLESCR